jgi:hypothetical protein
MSHTFKFVFAAAGFSVAGWLVGFFMSDRAPAPTEPAQTKASAEPASTALANLPSGRSARDMPKSKNKQARNSESAIFAALREPNELRRLHDLMEAVSEMGIDEISSTLVLAQKLSAQEQKSLMPVLVARWAELDPAAAAQFVLTLPESVIRSMTMRATLGVWFASSPEEAMAWASSLPPGQERSRTIDEVVRALAQRDPASAMLLLERFPKDRARDSSSYNVFSEWAKRDPRAAADYWLKVIPASGQDVNGALAKIASLWARSDPQEAFTWAQKLPESTAKNSTLSIIIGAMAGRDPQQAASRVAAAAAAWAGSLPEDEARASAFRSIARTWTGQDLGKAANWLDGLPASESRDAAVSAFTNQVSDSDPEGAVAWASTISDPNTRKVDLERIAITWMGRDEDAASRWIAATPSLAEDAKARLLAANK